MNTGNILSALFEISPDDNKFSMSMCFVYSEGIEEGEDAIIAVTEILKRPVHNFIAYALSCVYSSADNSNPFNTSLSYQSATTQSNLNA